MSVRRVLIYPEDGKQLRKVSTPVDRVKDVRELVRDLKNTLESQPGAGLAAPQIGVHQRVVVVRFNQDAGEMDPPLALINPVVEETGELVDGFDGCLSLPGLVTWDTLRPSWLVFSALDEKGKKFSMRVEGIDARLVHHEIDHLDGILFVDRLKPGDKLQRVVETEDGETLAPIDQLPSLNNMGVK